MNYEGIAEVLYREYCRIRGPALSWELLPAVSRQAWIAVAKRAQDVIAVINLRGSHPTRWR